ncbi:MAG: DUF1192 domain-containing protein [Pseudomonadota bacterium]
MEPEDLEPRRPKIAPPNLDPLSIDDLKDYIAQLEAEIERVRAVIASRKDHLSEAEKFFKS